MVRNSQTLIKVLELQFKWGVLYGSKLIISGSFATASCTRCKHKVTADEIREDIFAQRIPLCPRCPQVALPPCNDIENRYESYKGKWWIYHSLSVLFLSAQFCTSVPFFLSLFLELVSRGIMKPDIVFFGEGLPEIFHESMAKDKDECDLLIVIGSSLKVRPVALIPSEYTVFMVLAYTYPPYSHTTSQMPYIKGPNLWDESTCHLLDSGLS